MYIHMIQREWLKDLNLFKSPAFKPEIDNKTIKGLEPYSAEFIEWFVGFSDGEANVFS